MFIFGDFHTSIVSIFRNDYRNHSVVVGTHNLTAGGTAYAFGKAYRHPYYSVPSYANDIGLVKVASPIQFDDLVKPIEYYPHAIGGNETVMLSMFYVEEWDFL